MKFWASSESFTPAFRRVNEVRRAAEPYINEAISKSCLDQLSIEFRYIPIVMPTDLAVKYPARTIARIRQRVMVCAPHLKYELFLNTDFAVSLREYLLGIADCVDGISRFGATPDQVVTLRKILECAQDQVPLLRLDQARH